MIIVLFLQLLPQLVVVLVLLLLLLVPALSKHNGCHPANQATRRIMDFGIMYILLLLFSALKFGNFIYLLFE